MVTGCRLPEAVTDEHLATRMQALGRRREGGEQTTKGVGRADADNDVELVGAGPLPRIGADQLQPLPTSFLVCLLQHPVEAEAGQVDTDGGQRRLSAQRPQQPAAVPAAKVQHATSPGHRERDEPVNGLITQGCGDRVLSMGEIAYLGSVHNPDSR